MAAPRLKTDKNGWVVQDSHKNNPWAMVVIVVVIAVLVIVTYQRFMAFDTITYQVQACEQPLSDTSSWIDVEAAGCVPTSTAGMSFAIFEGGSRHQPDSVTDDSFVFDSYPVNSILHTTEFTSGEPAETIAIVDPVNEEIRTIMRGDRSGLDWSAYVGSRGPTEYWILITPRR